MSHSIKSMRNFLVASLGDFALTSGLDALATNDTLASLVASLAHYQEEGTKLVPELYLCQEIGKLVRAIPNNQVIMLGSHLDAKIAIELALKKGAPLAIEGWCIFVDASNDSFRFGIFRGSINPLALNIEKSVLSTPDQECPIVRVMQIAPGCIEVRNSNGVVHTFLLSDRSDETVMPSIHLDGLVKAACRLAHAVARDSLQSYLATVLGRGLQESHGALVVVTQTERVPKFLNDGIVLSPPIQLGELVLAARESSRARNDEESNRAKKAEQELLANSALIKGMIRSDGITVLSPKGALLGYNCFVKSSNRNKAVSGGARTRAYETLVTKIGKGLSAVFARSQDGLTKFEKR